MGRDRNFDLAHVKDLRVAPQSYSPSSMSAGTQFWGLSGGPIAFDYGAKTFRFGASLDEPEAREVVAAMSARHRFSNQSGVV